MIEIYCDGSRVKTNPGPGGWAAVLRTPGGETVLTGGASQTTAPRMELAAAIAAAFLVPAEAPAVIVSDSEYVVKGINGQVDNWIRKGWRTSHNNDAANPDLWGLLVAARDARPCLSFQWVAKKDRRPGNVRADELARAEAERWECRDGAASPRT